MSQGRAADGGGPQNGTARPAPGSAPAPGPIRRNIRVINPRGLHPRIIELFTRTAKRYTAEVAILNGEMRGNGKDVWDLIALLVLPDSDVVLEVDGPDAAAAVEPLAAILASPGGEDYQDDDVGGGI